MSNQQQQHLRFVDGMRAAAALLVVFHHAWLQSWPYTAYPWLKPHGTVALLTGWLAFGKLAVTAFIAISGFCLMLPIVRHARPFSSKRFFVRRCQRILPPYFAALVLALVLDLFLHAHTFTAYDDSLPVTFSGIVTHFLLIQNFTAHPYQISGPLWSIAVEFQIYLLFPLFVAIYRRSGILTTIAVSSVIGFATSVLFTRVGFPNTFAHYIVIFGFGMAACHFAEKVKQGSNLPVPRVCRWGIPLLVIGGVLFHHYRGSDKLVTDTLVGAATAAALLLSTVAPHGIIGRVLSVRPLVWIGSFSYSLYLVHFPLQQLFWQVLIHPLGLSRPLTFLLVVTLGTPLCIAFAFGFFMLVEKPSMSWSAEGRRRAHIAEAPLSLEPEPAESAQAS